MIVSLKGTLLAVTPLTAVIEAAGIGYEVHIPVTTAERLPAIGEAARLLTVAVYREDSQALYGFATAEERDAFRLLIEHVSGVGPKVALTILSQLTVPALRAAILDGNTALLAKCHGIGKKTAERLVVELKDKIAAGHGAGSAGKDSMSVDPGMGRNTIEARGSSHTRDAVEALVTLGYRRPDAERSVGKAVAAAGPNAPAEELIKRALAG